MYPTVQVLEKIKHDVSIADSKPNVSSSNNGNILKPENLEPKEWRTDQQINNDLLITAIVEYDDKLLDEVLPFAELDAVGIPSIDKVFTDVPPIRFAISHYNRNALKKLLEKGANVHTPDNNKNPPIATAVVTGDCEMVQTLLRYKAKLNYLASGGTALHSALRNVTGYSLTKHASWVGDKTGDLGNDLYDWFEGEGKKPNVESISGTFNGNEDLLELILEIHPELVFNRENDQPSPLEIAKDPKLLLKRFCDTQATPIECAAGADGVLILTNFKVFNRDMSDFVLVKELKFNFSRMRKAIYAAANVQDKASAMAIAAVDALKQDLHTVKTKAEVLHEQAAAHAAQMSALSQAVSPVTAKHNAEKRYNDRIKTAKDTSLPARKKFFDSVSKPLDATLQSYKTLSTGLFKRTNTSTADFIATGFDGLSGLLPPFASTAASLVGMLTKYYADESAQTKHSNITMLLPKSPADCAENIALELTEWLDNYLTTLNLTETEAETLAKKVRGVILVKLCDQGNKDNKLNPNEPIAKQLIHAVRTSKFIQEHLNTLVTKPLEARRKKISLNPSQKELFNQIHTRLTAFWTKFSSTFAKTADSTSKVNCEDVIRSFEKDLHPNLEAGQSVRKIYSRYLEEMSRPITEAATGEKVTTLNPYSLELLALELTEMAAAQAQTLKTDFPLVKQSAELSAIANNVAARAIDSIFVSLCSNFDSNVPVSQSTSSKTTNASAAASATTVASTFSMRTLDEGTLYFVNNLKADAQLQASLKACLATNKAATAATAATAPILIVKNNNAKPVSVTTTVAAAASKQPSPTASKLDPKNRAPGQGAGPGSSADSAKSHSPNSKVTSPVSFSAAGTAALTAKVLVTKTDSSKTPEQDHKKLGTPVKAATAFSG